MMNNFVVLRHRATGQALRLATVMTAAEGDAYVGGLNMPTGAFSLCGAGRSARTAAGV